MAKKKTAPVLRAQSEDPTPETPETPVITKSYSVRDDWKDKGVVNYVAFKSVDGEVQDLTVNGEPAGGGGDLSIARVVITNNRTGEIDINLAEIIEGGFIGTYINGPIHLAASETSNHKIPLYQGSNRTLFMGTAAVTGSISFAEGLLTVSGDGTITVS